MKCRRCGKMAAVCLPSHHAGFCPECFLTFFERQVARAVEKRKMIAPGDRVLVALSGGKDSLALMHVLSRLEYDVTGLHIDLGIGDSSKQARMFVESFCKQHGFQFMVFETASAGLPIPAVKASVKRPICSVCGKIKRHYFNRIAFEEGFDALATGHNLDDEVSRLFANTLRWDTAYLSDQGPSLPAEGKFVRKIKPLYRNSEFETAAYCFLCGIEHGKQPCPYSPGASFTGHKKMWAGLEETSPGSKLSFYELFLKQGRPAFEKHASDSGALLVECTECGFPTTFEQCGVCRIRAQVMQFTNPVEKT